MGAESGKVIQESQQVSGEGLSLELEFQDALSISFLRTTYMSIHIVTHTLKRSWHIYLQMFTSHTPPNPEAAFRSSSLVCTITVS